MGAADSYTHVRTCPLKISNTRPTDYFILDEIHQVFKFASVIELHELSIDLCLHELDPMDW